MKKFFIYLLTLLFSMSLFACEKTAYEDKAEKAANARAERNRADHERRNQ